MTIDAIGPRITGSVMFMATDDMVGTLSVSGGFGVISCL